MRNRVYEIIEVAHEHDRISTIYDFSMMVVILFRPHQRSMSARLAFSFWPTTGR